MVLVVSTAGDAASPIQIQVQIPVRRGNGARNSRDVCSRRRELLRDGARRLAQRPRELERGGHRQSSERAIGWHLDSKGGHVGETEGSAHGVGDLVVNLALNAEHHD